MSGVNAPFHYLGAEGNIGHGEVGALGPQAVIEDLGGPGTAMSHFKVSLVAISDGSIVS